MNSKSILSIFVLFLFLLFSSGVTSKPVFAANLDNISIETENVTAGLSLPVSIKNAGDGSGNIFIVEQGGRVRIYDGTQLLPDAFLDINTLVSNGREQGLLDIAFHPDYVNNGFFFIHYTDTQGDTVIAWYSRSAANPLVADPNSAVPILALPQPRANHNGGQMQFGLDGFLYIALGDGGNSGPAQDLNQLLGKILRIDIDNGSPYAIPADNPFVGVAGIRPEIWAYGLRNPWRMSFDRATGDLLIADVGQNRFEEINFQAAASPGGENYGWPFMEGNSCFQPSSNCNDGSLTLPILEYTHAAGNCSITGGYRYRGSTFPQLNGVYFHGDVCSGRIWGGDTDINGSWDSRILLDTTFSITTFGEDESGEVYMAAHGAGILFRINQINIPTNSNDVVLNLPGAGVSVLLNDNTSSAVLHADTAEAIAVADVDNNGEDDVIVSFAAGAGPDGTGGTYVSRNQGALTLLDSRIAEQIVVGNFDGVDGKDLMLDFGADGLYFALNDTAVTQLTPESPVTMAVGDTDNSGQDDVVLSFNAFGMINIRNFSVVDFLDSTPANVLELGDIDGNGEDDLFASFSVGQGPGGTGGLFVSVNQGALSSLTPLETLNMTSGDFDGSGQDDLLLDFGGATGLVVLFNAASVSPLGVLPVVAMTSGDVDNNGGDDMILSITGAGTIVFKNLTTVENLDPAVALHLATGNVDGN